MTIFVIKLIYDFLAGYNYPDSPYSQGVWNLPHKFHLYLIIVINYLPSITYFNLFFMLSC